MSTIFTGMAVRPFVPVLPADISCLRPGDARTETSAFWTGQGREFMRAAQDMERISTPLQIELYNITRVGNRPLRKDTVFYSGERILQVMFAGLKDGVASGFVSLRAMERPDAAMIVSGERFFNLSFDLDPQIVQGSPADITGAFEFQHEGDHFDIILGHLRKEGFFRKKQWGALSYSFFMNVNG